MSLSSKLWNAGRAHYVRLNMFRVEDLPSPLVKLSSADQAESLSGSCQQQGHEEQFRQHWHLRPKAGAVMEELQDNGGARSSELAAFASNSANYPRKGTKSLRDS